MPPGGANAIEGVPAKPNAILQRRRIAADETLEIRERRGTR